MLPVFYTALLVIVTPEVFFKVWTLAYCLFLIIGDPLLLSQHSGVPQKRGYTENDSVIPFKDQDEYTRSLVFPEWVTKYILLGFDKHVVHHIFPAIPGYHLWKVKTETAGRQDWFEWLSWAKEMDAHKLLFSAELNLIQDDDEKKLEQQAI